MTNKYVSDAVLEYVNSKQANRRSKKWV